MKNIIFFLLIIFSFSCNVDLQKKIEVENSKFSTSDASELFFKNVRQTDYDKVEMKEAKLNVFRIQERTPEADYPNLIPAIVINWRHDEAYLLIEPNSLVPQDSILIKWIKADTIQQGEYKFHFGDKNDHFTFSSLIYESLVSDHNLFIIKEDDEIPILNKDKDREAFRKTVKDYYRLVELL